MLVNKKAAKGVISAALLKRAFVACVLFSLAEIAVAADVQVSEIRLHSITGYGHDRFTLKIHSNGKVQYLGRNFVDVKGRRTSQISAADFNKLVRKVQQIRFFQLDDQYDRHPLDKPPKVSAGAAQVEGTIVTDQPRQIVSVVALHGMKSVEDRMGPPKGLRELEEQIIEVTDASRWIGSPEDLHDIPYYESFPLNKRVTFRVLLEHYRTGGDPKQISGYLLMFMKNNGVILDVEASHKINLSKFDGYIVDATGYIKESSVDHVFVVRDIRPVRRYH